MSQQRVLSAVPTSAPRAKILVVEDDPATAGVVKDLLESSGYRVYTAVDGAQAKEIAEELRPDLVILDVMLPDVDGLVLCGDLRARSDARIIVVSGTSRKRDGTLALRLGADDFVPKPFDIYDLEARVEAVLRRVGPPRVEAEHASPEAQYYRVGDLMIARHRRHVTLGGQEIPLTPTEYRLLCMLAGHLDEGCSREELAEDVWGYDDVSQGRAIDVHIRRLRMKLDVPHARSPHIVSVRGLGYKLESGQLGISSVA